MTGSKTRRRVEYIAVAVLWAALLPVQELISLWLSYPMRRIATEGTSAVLSALGFAVETEYTSIRLEGSSPIVIADACSGVEGTIALMFVGWIVARVMQRGLGTAVVQYLFAMPSIVCANVVRLVFTVLGFHFIGQVVLEPTCHQVFGFLQLALAFVMFWMAGLMVRKASE